jgi:mRNA-degrading endonuclease RelE of RelBE toxin-antitoxin system
MADIVWSRVAERELAALDRGIAARIFEALERFAATGAGDVKTLQGAKGVKRLRVGPFRVRRSHGYGPSRRSSP